MRPVAGLVLLMLFVAAAQAQVIPGESTDDSAYAPRPVARWHSPESQGAVPDNARRDDELERGVPEARPRD